MHLNIVANSALFLLLGLGIMMGGVAAALVLEDLRPLLLVLLGLAFTIRLEKDAASKKMAELARTGIRAKKVDKQFFGVFGDYFVVGPVEVAELQAAESLAKCAVDAAAERSLSAPGGFADTPPIPIPPAIQVWPLSSIDTVSFASDGNSFTISQQGAEFSHRFTYTHNRDQVLKILKLAAGWEISRQYRKVFRLNIIVAILCLLVMFFAIALTFTSIGLIQPNQLPLADWNDVQQLRGKARGAMTMWFLLCEAYLFVINNLHPGLACVLGTLIAVGFGCLLYAAQWTRVSDTTWTQRIHRYDE